ncbi:MAG: pyruvate:ferredoxin (flavodoxin) oxidoreductase [Bacteroidetes bacterium 4572_77]|nr:MAG: pyruvate:ferredoxin (flavodoxin) oxidoreductase [Bacteroidetes bacterium 4572_77]
MAKKFKTVSIDGNTATTHSAYAFSEVASIYPITPSSDMGEMADAWAAKGLKNIFGEKLDVKQMQSEAGAAGACHGALSGGTLTSTYTASQGLLLMLPNMFKIAGEMQPGVIHCSARSIAAQSLSIFGDHSDVMACRSTGFGMLASNNPQEAQDLAAVAHLVAIESSIPFLHFFDGFRTSHTIQNVEQIDYDTFKEMVNMDAVRKFREEAMKPESPYCKVGAQNPDVYFQGRETTNNQYRDLHLVVKKYMDKLYDATGRRYELFEYIGDPNAEKIIIAMGSGADTIHETVDYLTAKGEKVGAIIVRLYRPFNIDALKDVIPASVKKIAVLDRTKEPGAIGEPLYLDVVATLQKRPDIDIYGGRYGLSSKEFTPSMIKAVYDHLDNNPWHGFTVGINDDVSNLSIPIHEEIDTEDKSTVRCKFWGYGSDGTVGASKNSIKIIGEGTDKYVQGYFQYDSNKSGGYTVSHLRFGDKLIRSQYLVHSANFISCSRPQYIGKYDLLDGITEGGTFLLNSEWKPEEVWEHLTADMQKTIIDKKVKVYCIDAGHIAKEVGLGGRRTTVMQTVFFKLSGILPADESIQMIKDYIKKTFLQKGQDIVDMNWKAVDASVSAVCEVPVPATAGANAAPMIDIVPEGSGDFAMNVIDPVARLKGDDVKVSQMPINGVIPVETNRLQNKGRATKALKKPMKYDFIDNNKHNFEHPYVEYIPSCKGCGEIQYVMNIAQLFGDRMMIANATGCSSIYGGTFPNIPWAKDANGHGPTWANSLFEDNAEYAYGMRLAVNQNRKLLKSNSEKLIKMNISAELKAAIEKQLKNFKELTNDVKADAISLKVLLTNETVTDENKCLLADTLNLADYYVEKSVWAFGGDGWAYDIGYGGLDHIMASSENVNVLVMDTEVYSNTGGQASKATPRGAIAKFAADGKKMAKKNLGLMITTYGNAYVAQINMMADHEQALKAIKEAEEYDGPSILIGYSPCIAHGIDLKYASSQSKKAHTTGYWPMYRFDPRKDNPFTWESPVPSTDFDEYVDAEVRYNGLKRSNPEEYDRLRKLATVDNARRIEETKGLAD